MLMRSPTYEVLSLQSFYNISGASICDFFHTSKHHPIFFMFQ
ncbi:hypothetical protein NSP_33010 [Nodularia spumigena CCY9414]|nr:hypothetical protein NSP_33010 [Nodularia spumigena CCY9414]